MSVSVKLQLVACAETFAKEKQKSALFLTSCKYWAEIAASLVQDEADVALEHLNKVYQIALKNSQVALALIRAIGLNTLVPEMAQLLVDLAVYGDVPKKDDSVLYLAHKMAKKNENHFDE